MKGFWSVALLTLCAAAGAQDTAPAPDETTLAAVADPAGYAPLLKDDLSNAIIEKDGWTFVEGVLTAQGKGDLWTKEKYGDFALVIEFKCDPETNSGVFLRCGSLVNWLHTAIEVQILQPNDGVESGRWQCGGIFDCIGPVKQAVKPAGEWNRFVIVAKGTMIWVQLNGEWVTSMNLDLWTEAHKNPDGTPNKFENAYKDMPRTGNIGLQYHGHPVWFRNGKIKQL